MTPDELDKTVMGIEALADVALPVRQQWIRKVTAGAQRCCVDKQGRMVLPPEFCAKAGLQGEVTLAGVMGQFQIWNSQRWETQQAAEAADTQEFANRLGL
ncbi:MAG: division/cell wall cluster transcriptional repressor MraZ [Verrucomicrobiota bacterium]